MNNFYYKIKCYCLKIYIRLNQFKLIISLIISEPWALFNPLENEQQFEPTFIYKLNLKKSNEGNAYYISIKIYEEFYITLYSLY